MKRIDTATRATDLFGPGKHGFKDGNPLTGDPSTTLSASMFNHLQEEIARAVEAGGAPLDPTKYDQLATVLGLAVRSAGASGYFGLPGGLLLQWGTATFTDPGSGLGASYSTVAVTVPFPRPFSAAPWVVLVTGADAGEGLEHTYGLAGKAADQCAIRAGRVAGGQGGGEVGSFNWLALGQT
ncbi:hypothetical protein D9623_16335 [Azospirillum brasilense]|uniref:Putative tail fiber protein gp53-like C-terminal domain-containing protein n=1 Tax=Azospirillum brasilense TaxID=192 RepID=A0A0P0F170_AZOBR|nr:MULTISPECIES: hypothetical protein [Azospirillum]ALJ36885.1 hypothetical protein AMK58_15305 [Azospirillum brasilense]MDW7555807.1 hypothetical protein [Azospirillum brasilense]MDW7595884.1 hypothetical protein [Azospirillum brasilense]MDW7630889.1 hypothetical protein [Azospirillum brasilense]MDX5951495.1 hypothetical protein [Azospirillum brasilense]